MKVSDKMTRNLRMASPDDSTREVARTKGDRQIRRLPVVNRDKRLVGILSLGDIATGEGPRPGGAHSQTGGPCLGTGRMRPGAMPRASGNTASGLPPKGVSVKTSQVRKENSGMGL